MNKKTYSQVLEDVARDNLPVGLDLTPQIMARVQKRKGTSMQPRMKVLVTISVVLLVLAVVLMNAPAVAAAIQRWFGYIPGFGLVHDNQLRQLAEPVSVSQGAFTLTVEKALLNNEKVVINYRLDGITAQLLDEKQLCLGSVSAPVLRLSNGRNLDLRANSTSHGGGAYTGELTYLSPPMAIDAAALIIHCVDNTALDKVPQNWEVPLRFVTASPALTVAPVLEAPATLEPTAVANVASPLTATTLPVVFQDGLVLKNVIPNSAGYILSGTILVIPPEGYTVEQSDGYLEDVTITDASGQVLQVGIAPDDVVNSILQQALPENTYGWACQVYSEQLQWPLTMTVHSVAARGPQLPQAEFQIDVGPNPKVDQVWELDRNVSLGTKTVQIVSLQRVKDFHGLSGYLFKAMDDPTVAFSFDLQGYQGRRQGGGGSGSPDENNMLLRLLSYAEPVPDGLLTVLISGYELVKLPGPWQVTWQAPLIATPAP
jgi:hypothetical protein